MRRHSISAFKALLLSKSGVHCGQAAGDAARVEVRFSQAPPQASGRRVSSERARSREASLWAEACGGRARSSPGRSRGVGAETVRGQRRLQRLGVAGVPRLSARRSPGRGGCCSCSLSPRARPPRSPAPATAEGRLAWRGPGGARGGRLHRVARHPQIPASVRASESVAADALTRGRSCRVGEVRPLVGRGLRSPGSGRVHQLQAPVSGTRASALLPPGPATPGCTVPLRDPPPSTHPR